MNEIHNCPDMKTENTIRLFDHKPEFAFQMNMDGFVELVCGDVAIVAYYCPCCGVKLRAGEALKKELA